MKRLVLLCLLCSSGLFAGVVLAKDAWQWLDDLSSALQTLNYDGTFVYLHDNKLEAMRIIHRSDDRGEHERLLSLTGSPREVIRDYESVTCIMSDNKSVMVSQSRPGQPFPVVPRDLESLSGHYTAEDLGDDRIAGYMARVISITPKDSFRYGYRFWIEKHSKMLLKSDMTGADGKAIEQVMFTRLTIGGVIPDHALKPSLEGKDYTWYIQPDEKQDDKGVLSGQPGWTVLRLPAGFSQTHYQSRRLQPKNKEVEHIVFSDGLATVSIYIEASDNEGDSFTGLSEMGAMNAYSVLVNGYQVTAVGEVPAVTVQMIAGSARQNIASLP